MNELQIVNSIKMIFRYYHLGTVNICSKINNGFSRMVFNVNNMYIIKICVNHEKEGNINNELSFYSNHYGDYYPNLIVYDDTKKILPYIYTIEEKINGNNLFEIWSTIDDKSKKKILFSLVEVLRKIHKTVEPFQYNELTFLNQFDELYQKCIKRNIFSKKETEYLQSLRLHMIEPLHNAKVGYIHGDLHFNNIFWTGDKIKLIDFENYGISYIDKDFDSLNRMSRNPSSFLYSDNKRIKCNFKDYEMIMDYFKEIYPEICKEEQYDDRLLIYDCINSIKWIYYYPNYKLYHDVLFQNSKKLVKKL